MIKLASGALLFFLVAASPEIRYFRYQRTVQNLPQQPGQACLALDAGIFAHAAPQLADLRLYRDGVEAPYATHLATPIEQGQEKTIASLNLGIRGGQTVFDAELPEAHYSDLQLAITAENFIATVNVTGSRAQAGSAETRLGSYTIFDLTKQKLGRSTVLHLPESDFKYLHFRIVGPVSPQEISGLSVERLPASQPSYVTVAESSQIMQKDHSSVVEFTVPAHVPVDRIVFAPGATPAMFSRDVAIRVTAVTTTPEAGDHQPAVFSNGNLLRIHSVQNGRKIDEERLSIDAPASDFDMAAKWTIAIDNGDDEPLKLESVRLQMLERQLCFDSASSGGGVLYYGDSALSAPRYDYATLFAAKADAAQVAVGPEKANPAYQPRPDERAFTEKHPALLWIALVAVVALLGTIALRSVSKSTPAA